MAHRFTVILEKEEEGGYHVFCPVLPRCHTQSETIEEGIQNIRETIQLMWNPHRRWPAHPHRRHSD